MGVPQGVQWHPHLHLLTTDGGKTANGPWQPLPECAATLLMSLFRERLLARLVLAHAISPELGKKVLAWKHPGFSAHVGERISPTDKLRLEDTAAYLVRSDQHSINRIPEHLGLRPPEPGGPPPAREILRVAEQGEGWGVPADWD